MLSLIHISTVFDRTVEGEKNRLRMRLQCRISYEEMKTESGIVTAVVSGRISRDDNLQSSFTRMIGHALI